VMESKQSDCTSVVNNEAANRQGDASGNSEQALRRRVRENWKSLHVAFKHASDSEGDMTPVQLREVLYRFDIIMADKQYNALCIEMDEDGDGMISYQEFLKYFGVGSDHDKDVVGTITGISVDDAITMIRDKVRGRLRSGPSELRRTFQFFDRDGSGSVDFEEMAVTLKLSCGIQFEESLLKQVIAKFDPEDFGELDFTQFTAMVSGSGENDGTSFESPTVRKPKLKKNVRMNSRPTSIGSIQEGHIANHGMGRESPSILKNIDERIARQAAKHEESMLRITGSSFAGVAGNTGSSFFLPSGGSSQILLPPV